MPTIFIALQCCQCSTMQVKQQKKSNNKWTCVVCNQKQSVRKIYAQGFMAKDVRKFVQSFNMSRQLAEQHPPFEDDPKETLAIEDQSPTNRKQRRTDWSEYIDPAEEELNSCDFNEKLLDESEPKMVTEMPKAVFKKPKLKNYASKFNTEGNRAPDSSRRLGRGTAGGNPEWRENAAEIRKSFSAQEDNNFENKVAWKNQLATAKEAPKWSCYVAEASDDLPPASCRDSKIQADDPFQNCRSFSTPEDFKFESKVPLKNKLEKDKGASKWSCYIREDSEDLPPARGKDTEIQADPFENELNDQRVEEDIHPDFL